MKVLVLFHWRVDGCLFQWKQLRHRFPKASLLKRVDFRYRKCRNPNKIRRLFLKNSSPLHPIRVVRQRTRSVQYCLECSAVPRSHAITRSFQAWHAFGVAKYGQTYSLCFSITLGAPFEIVFAIKATRLSTCPDLRSA